MARRKEREVPRHAACVLSCAAVTREGGNAATERQAVPGWVTAARQGRSLRTRGWAHRLFFLLVFLGRAGATWAQGEPGGAPALSEETLLFSEVPSVYGASRYEQLLTEAPAAVSIVTAAEIQKFGYRTLADILRGVRGFYVTGDRNYQYLGVRGFCRPGDYNTRVLLLMDGHRINDNLYETAAIGRDFVLDVDLIDRVEIIRGPSSSLYGTNALFGVINVITKKGRELKGLEVSGEVADHATGQARLSYGDRYGTGLEMLLSGSFYSSDGRRRLYYREFDDPASNNGIAEWGDEEQSYSLFSSLSLQDFALAAAFDKRRKDIPTAPWGIIFNDSRNISKDERAFLDLSYRHDFEQELEIEARLFLDHTSSGGEYVYDYAEAGEPPIPVLNRDVGEGNWWGGEFQATKRIRGGHRFILGGEFRDNFDQDLRNYDLDPYLLLLDVERHGRTWAVFGQGEYRILEPLTLSLGVRYDHYDTFGGTTNPRIALLYHPFEATTFKFLFGQAFRAPNLYELTYHDGYLTQKDNPALEPERIRTYELVYEQDLGENFRLAASGFLYRIGGLISQQLDPADGLLVFQNLDEAEARGLEVELEGKWPSGLEGRIAYTLQQVKDVRTGEPLSNSPMFLAYAGLVVPLLTGKVFASWDAQVVSRRKTLAGATEDTYVLANFTLFSRRLVKGLEASASVYNLFDEHYHDPGSEEHLQDMIEQDGRTFRVKLTYRF